MVAELLVNMTEVAERTAASIGFAIWYRMNMRLTFVIQLSFSNKLKLTEHGTPKHRKALRR